jgi:hypothetical protein
MKRLGEKKRKPVLSNYQIHLRRMTIKLMIIFVVLAMAVGMAFYYYERHSLIP